MFFLLHQPAYVLFTFVIRGGLRSLSNSSSLTGREKICFSQPELGPSNLGIFLSQDPEGGLVVLSGGGTSGRMAFLMSVSTLIAGFPPSAFLG